MDFFTHVTFLASLAVIVLQQILKLNIIPSTFVNRYPVPSLMVLSAISAFVVDWTGAQTVQGFTGWLVLGATIAAVAAIVYNATLRNWPQLRAMEQPTPKFAPPTKTF